MSSPSVRAPQGLRARQTYERLLDAGEALLARAGFDALTTTAVATEAGVSTGTFYLYLADKHALLHALFARRLDALVDEVARVLTADRLLDEGLEATLDGALVAVLDGYRRHAVVLRAALPRVPLRPELRAVYWERHARSVDVVERFLRRAARAGMAAPGDIPVRAQAMLVLTQSLNHPVLLSAEDPQLVAGIRAQLGRALAAIVAAPT